MASLIKALATTAKAVADTIQKNKEEKEETKPTETLTTGDGVDMTIHPKESSGSRLSKYSSGGSGGTSTDYGTYQSDLNKLTNAQRQAQIDELKAAKKKALANLDAQEQNIKPMYENARNQTSAASQQGARNFAEYLANRGLTNSGAAAQGEINRLSTLQNNLGNLNTAEANAYRDIANQRTAIANDYAANLANANNSITSNYYNNLLNYNQQQRQYIQDLQNQANYQYYDNIQARINELLAQGYSPNSQEVLQLEALRGGKAYNQYQAGMNNAQNNVNAGYVNYNNAAALGLTVPQAYQASNDYQAAQKAAAEAALEQQNYERQVAADKVAREVAQQELTNQINLQKLANDTAKTQYDVNKPYNTTIRYVSSGGNSNNDTNSLLQKITANLITQYPELTDQQIADILNG